MPNYGCPPIRGRVPGLPLVLPGWEDPCANFLGSRAVFFWGFGVLCGWVKLVSSSLGSIWRVSTELRMPTHKGRVSGLPIVLPGWGDPCANFLKSGAVVFWSFWVRCGRVIVSSSLGSIWGVSAELRMPTHKRKGTWATRGLTRLGRPLRKFLGVRCCSFLGFWGPVR